MNTRFSDRLPSLRISAKFIGMIYGLILLAACASTRSTHHEAIYETFSLSKSTPSALDGYGYVKLLSISPAKRVKIRVYNDIYWAKPGEEFVSSSRSFSDFTLLDADPKSKTARIRCQGYITVSD